MADYKKPDHWQLKARNEGYPARSVYKLKEIDEKFRLVNPSHNVLDIGAAPGSWSLYVLRKMSQRRADNSVSLKGFLAAADLSPLSREFDNDPRNKGLFDNEKFFFLQGDITTSDVRESLLSKGPYNVIISDVAPSTTGSRLIDSARSLELVETVIDYAQAALSKEGSLAVKIFQGSGTDTALKHLKTLFATAKSFKPEACRGESVETYFVGIGLK